MGEPTGLPGLYDIESETKRTDKDESKVLARTTGERKLKFAEIWRAACETSQG